MTQNMVHAGDIATSVYQDAIDRWGRGKDLSITSIPKLDNMLWGFSKQKLVVVGGRTSMGKSTLMAQLALDFALQKKKVMFFSLEMTNKIVVQRLISNRCQVDNSLIHTGRIALETEKHHGKISEFITLLKTVPLVLIQSEGKTFPEIMSIIESLKQDVDAVFLDYIQMASVAPRQTRRDAIDEYIKELRKYAIQKNFCAVIGSQINRGTHEGHKTRRPKMYELKESGAVEEISDVVLLVHWEYGHEKDNEDIKNEYEIEIAKNRDGITGRVACKFYPEFYKITEGGGDEGYTPNIPRKETIRTAYKSDDSSD